MQTSLVPLQILLFYYLSFISEAIVGLDSSNAENLQRVSYSIGGHYEPHVDYFNSIHAADDEMVTDRLSTMLFYLNDVAAGGATVFPLLNISVPPVAGLIQFVCQAPDQKKN